MRNAMLVFMALLADGLQALLSFAFLGIAGTISGATFGLASPVAVPAGFVLGVVVDVCISATIGAGLLLLLAYYDMYYFGPTLGGGIAELLPGIDVIPAWTLMTILCIVRKSAEEGKGGIAGKAVAAVASGANPTAVMAAVAGGNPTTPQQTPFSLQASTPAAEDTTGRASMDLKNIDGIRALRQPANDNGAQTKLHYAA